MQTTIQLLTSYLPRYGWPAFQVVEDTPAGGKILTGWSSPFAQDRLMFIMLDHREQMLVVVVPALVSAPQEEMPISRLADVLSAIGFANFALPLGRIAYDPNDGEIRYAVGMPTDKAELTFEQFQHLLNAAQGVVTYWAPRIKAVVDGERTGGEVVESFMGHVRGFAL